MEVSGVTRYHFSHWCIPLTDDVLKVFHVLIRSPSPERDVLLHQVLVRLRLRRGVRELCHGDALQDVRKQRPAEARDLQRATLDLLRAL